MTPTTNYPHETLFHISHQGDPTTGDYGDTATVQVTIYDQQHYQQTINALKNAFRNIWDAKYIQIETDEQYQANQNNTEED